MRDRVQAILNQHPPMRMFAVIVAFFIALLLLIFINGASAQPSVSRIKEIAKLDGIQENQLIGYGLVAGLNGTGDGRRGFTAQSLNNLVAGMGVNVIDPETITTEVVPENVAAVIVTANLPPFARPGTKIDATVISIGRSSSLQGGYLISTPLKGADGQWHGIAQGPVSIGGFIVSGGGGGGAAGGAVVQENHTTVGRVPNGIIIEGEYVQHEVLQDNNTLRWLLSKPDWKTASNMQRKINSIAGRRIAIAEDASAILVKVGPPGSQQVFNENGQIILGDRAFNSLVDAIAYVEEAQIETDQPARIVINERTGTVVAGLNIRVDDTVVAHGPLRITIQNTPEVTPAGLGPGGAPTTTNTATATAQTGDKVAVIKGTTIGDVVTNLNALGYSPRDLIAILQLMAEAGAIKAEIVIQ
ncbi:flagellar basal body P-ring protein FlgI [bacterium]|nr:flagellar basal body P-ring protein FlgI [bacterium]